MQSNKTMSEAMDLCIQNCLGCARVCMKTLSYCHARWQTHGTRPFEVAHGLFRNLPGLRAFHVARIGVSYTTVRGLCPGLCAMCGELRAVWR